MIADVVNYAIAAIGFIHAVGRLFVRRPSQPQEHCYDANWTRRRDQCLEGNIRALTKAP